MNEPDSFASLPLDRDDKKEASVSATLAFTYHQLPEAQKAQFRQLGMLPLGISVSRAHLYALWGVGDSEVLDVLLSGGLLEEVPGVPERYIQHHTLRTYAQGLLRAVTVEFLAARDRHYRYVINFANQPETWDTFAADVPLIAAMGDELVATVTGTHDSAAQDELLKDGAIPIPEPLRDYCSEFSYPAARYIFERFHGVEGRRWLWLGLAAARATKRRNGEDLFLSELGVWHHARGYRQDAVRYYEASLLICREQGDRWNEAATLQTIGGMYWSLGDNQRALTYYEQALLLAQTMGKRGNEAATLYYIGGVYRSLGDNQRALEYYEQAIPITQEAGNRHVEALTLNEIGAIYEALGDLDKAIVYVAHGVELAEQLAHPNLENNRAYLDELRHKRDGIPNTRNDQDNS